MHGSDGGGILGVGSIGQLVGMLGGGVLAGSVGSWISGWNDPSTVTARVTQFFSNASTDSFHNGPAAK